MKIFKPVFALLCALWLVFASFMQSAAAASLIRDAEIEDTLHLLSKNIFEAAGLTPSSIRFFIVQDPDINAFVAGGENIFIHTGLLLATESPGMLIGVIAHETGHIAGGHLARGTEKLKDAQLGTILSMVLGAAVAVGGSGQGGMAVMSAGQQAAMRGLISFTRANEQAADQAALGFLDKSNISAQGMLKMFEVLRRQENLHYGDVSPYALTHPLSKERITHIRNHVMQSSVPETLPEEMNDRYYRMIAKLYGFIEEPQQTLIKYPLSDHSLYARYARAVAFYKIPDLKKSLAEIDSLLKEKPDDPFFNELKGQILFENGRINEALTCYQKAVNLLPDAPLIRVDLAKVQLATEKKELLTAAARNLERANAEDNTNAYAWRLLATAYGKQGQMGMSALALAEEAALQNKPNTVIQQVNQATTLLDAGSPARLRASDLKVLAEKMKKDKDAETNLHFTTGAIHE